MFELHTIFPTVVGVAKLETGLSKPETAIINKFLETVRPSNGNHVSLSLDVLNHPNLSRLKDFIDKSILQYSQSLNIINTQFHITQSWLNLAFKGEFLNEHYHPNHIWTGTFYVQTGEDDRLEMRYTNPCNYELEVSHYSHLSALSWDFPAIENQLIIFPSNMRHYVPPTKNEQRISLSFNVSPTIPFGKEFDYSQVRSGYAG
jgi:uncharacterized protein (TIGR02466 family)